MTTVQHPEPRSVYPPPPPADYEPPWVSPPPPQPEPGAPEPSRSDRARSILGTSLRLLFAAAGISAAFFIDNSIFGGLVVLFAIVVPFEKLYPRKKGQRVRRPMAGTDIGFALMGPLLNVVGVAAAVVIGAASLLWVPGLLVRPLVAMLPGWSIPIAAFLMFDFLVYWTHRWAHEVPFLWRFHAVHHSPEHMDWVSGFRIHPFDGVRIAPAFVFLLAAGFDVEVAGVLALLQILLGIFFHANVRVRWRWLDRIACNPEFHHWHHANESDAIGHNYGGALPWWDLMFGTFFMPKGGRRPQHYGVDEYLPRHMWGLLLYPLRGGRERVRFLWHPITGVKRLLPAVRTLLRDVWTTSRRPTHSVRRQTAPGSYSTNASLFDPDDAPGRRPTPPPPPPAPPVPPRPPVIRF